MTDTTEAKMKLQKEKVLQFLKTHWWAILLCIFISVAFLVYATDILTQGAPKHGNDRSNSFRGRSGSSIPQLTDTINNLKTLHEKVEEKEALIETKIEELEEELEELEEDNETLEQDDAVSPDDLEITPMQANFPIELFE
jgi:septal ring factor EnvC (AmiA/AmiB activator)